MFESGPDRSRVSSDLLSAPCSQRFVSGLLWVVGLLAPSMPKHQLCAIEDDIAFGQLDNLKRNQQAFLFQVRQAA